MLMNLFTGEVQFMHDSEETEDLLSNEGNAINMYISWELNKVLHILRNLRWIFQQALHICGEIQFSPRVSQPWCHIGSFADFVSLKEMGVQSCVVRGGIQEGLLSTVDKHAESSY